MKLELTYIIQALDNVSPNIIEQNGKLLNPEIQVEDMVRRQCTSKASEISLNGHQEIYSKNLRVFYTDSDFLIEVITEQFDNAGRMVPVVVHGHFPEYSQDWISEYSQDWIIQLKEDIKRFLSSSATVTSTVEKLTLKSDVYDLITEKIGEIWRKKKALKVLKNLAILILIFAILPALTERILQETHLNLLRVGLIGFNNIFLVYLTRKFLIRKS